MKIIIYFIFSIFLSTSAYSQDDKRLNLVAYDSTKIYDIYTKIGLATLIQFEEDETIQEHNGMLGIGYKHAWEIGVKGNNIVFKPKKTAATTNLIIVTNKRTYAFDLKQVSGKFKPTYMIKFTYPEDELNEKLMAIREATNRNRITGAAKSKKIIINTDYFWRGENDLLKPTAAWDNGQFTYLEYDHAGSLPVFYKIGSDGKEAIVNYQIENNLVVLQEVVEKFIVRLGDSVIEILNKKYIRPNFNTTGTAEFGAVRKLKGATND